MRNSFDPTAGLIQLGLRLAMYAFIVWLAIQAVKILVVGGAVYGSAISLRNYGLAFANNIKLRRTAP